MSLFKPSLIMLALASAGMMPIAYAAEENTDNIEVLEVTGIRGSMQAAQAIKKGSKEVVESINAEDIGKLPDVSIAESLARLPGLTAQRLDGRANVVSIRGLAPDFTVATLNGREQVTVGDNRGVEFDQYPSELINSVVVYKTPNAALLSQAIGGTVDMQTVKPLSFAERTIAVNARGEYNDLGKLNPDGDDKGYRASFSIIDQFLDNTLGVAFGYAKLFSPNQEERWQAWGYPTFENSDNLVLGGAKPYVRSSTLERDGLMLVVEYQPTDNFTSMFDAYYTKFKDTQLLRGIEIPGAWGGRFDDGAWQDDGWANAGISNATVENGLVTSGTFDNAKVLVRNDVNERDADTWSLGWNGEYVVNDDWTVDMDLAYSKADRQDFGLETYAGTSRGNGCLPADASGYTGCADLGFSMDGDRGAMFTNPINYADSSIVKLGGPFSWGNNVTVPGNGQDGFINTPSTTDELTTARLTAQRFLDNEYVSAFEFGVNYSTRTKTKEDKGYFLTLAAFSPNGVTGDLVLDQNDMLTVPDQYLLGSTSLDFIGMGNILTYDAMGLLRDGYYTLTDEGQTVSSRITNSWEVKEDVTTAYVMADIDTEIKGMALVGNAGVQMVHTKQSSNGNAVTAADDGTLLVQPSYGEDSYTEFLPSTNLSLEVVEDQQLRFAVARTLARARMDQMNAGLGFSYDPDKTDSTDILNSPWSGSGGNPELRPWMAWQYDLGYEVYMDEGYFAVGLFYKDLENYIYDQDIEVDFSDITAPGGYEPKLNAGIVSVPVNGEGGYIRGAEFSAHMSGEVLHDALSGFGIILSGSYNESEVKETADSDPLELPGLSKKTGNATFYYEDYGFEARVSARYRSDFLGEVTGLSLARQEVFVKGETLVDAQIGYDFSEIGYEGLSVLFQVTNLTDEPFVTYENGDSRQVRDYQVYGRNYMMGVNYNF